MKKVFTGSLLAGMVLFFCACSSDDTGDPVGNEKIEVTIGSADPIIFSGSCMKLSDNTYQLSGNANDDSGLSFTISWQGEEPKGTFAWNANFETNAAGTWLLMANGDMTKSYYSYDAANGEVTGNRSGSLVIEKFGGVDGFVEGTFEVTNARLLEVSNATANESIVKITAKFKVSRSI
ncbi:hypothetical protein [uncultured Imperialibacter sp.]|uniref:hypothetical protein n=1 Tax=uncultured Imperialibacter sp. TaxID=1672639 RepID=UPI0030D7B663|tara:strand:+ start:36174 stop:36707 length:534 start_codon:yes stop_codon:yes gene_type:complete